MYRAAIAFTLTLLTSPVVAQSPPTVVGTWRLISFVDPGSTDRPRPYWDDKPSGLAIYTAEGLVSAQLYDTRWT